jgi:ATP-dependent Lon protease
MATSGAGRVERGKVISVSERGLFPCKIKTSTSRSKPAQLDALTSRVTGLFEQYAKLSQNVNYDTIVAAIRGDDPGKLADTVGANLQLSIEEKQELLEIFDPIDRLTRVAEMLDIEIEKLNVDRTIQGRVKRQMEKAQKEYYLNEKIKAIQKELRRKRRVRRAQEENRHRGHDQGRPQMATAELAPENMPPMSANHRFAQLSDYWAVPWRRSRKRSASCPFAQQVLESDHYGLGKLRAHSRIPGRTAAGEGSQG